MNDITTNSSNVPELQCSFEQQREVDAGGKEWWNSRKFTLTWVRCE